MRFKGERCYVLVIRPWGTVGVSWTCGATSEAFELHESSKPSPVTFMILNMFCRFGHLVPRHKQWSSRSHIASWHTLLLRHAACSFEFLFILSCKMISKVLNNPYLPQRVCFTYFPGYFLPSLFADTLSWACSILSGTVTALRSSLCQWPMMLLCGTDGAC